MYLSQVSYNMFILHVWCEYTYILYVWWVIYLAQYNVKQIMKKIIKVFLYMVRETLGVDHQSNSLVNGLC